MKRLFVCCDGTWNSAVDTKYGMPVPTNVVKFYNAVIEGNVIDAQGRACNQLRYYHRGVGAKEGWAARLLDGATGGGLGKNIVNAYHWLSSNYEQDCEIFIVGFSRGAFTARSLAGMLHCCGLEARTDWDHTRQKWLDYVNRKHARKSEAAGGASATLSSTPPNPLAPVITFLGVWDTVGALGVPTQYDLLALFDKKYQFHDTTLSPKVRNACHALALDEERSNFFPTLWTDIPVPGQTLDQTWFTGVHADIGGGYTESGLSDITLKWMIEKAQSCGAVLRDDMLSQISPDVRGILHDSLSPIYKWIGYQPRSVPALGAAADAPFNQRISAEALLRRERPPISQAPYRPGPDVHHMPGGQDVAVFADTPWNWSGVYLRKGVRYRFTAVGAHHWGSRTVTCDASGYTGSFVRRILSPLKRVGDENWLALCGAIASGLIPTVEGDPPLMRPFTIFGKAGAQPLEYTPTESGYLYLFGNDARHLYSQNKGRVIVNISVADEPATAPQDDDHLVNAPATSHQGSGLPTQY